MLQNFILMFVYTHSHIPCHCEAHSNWALHNHPLGISFLLYMKLGSCSKGYKLAVLYTLTQDASYTSHGQDPDGSYIVTYLCINNPESINN
jgi:hypothetical protein